MSATAIVTGGASGIGRATCALLARDGYAVAVVDRDEDGARSHAATIGGRGYGLDVADETAVAGVFATIAHDMPPISALATAAGIIEMTPFDELDAATFQRVYAINVIGTFSCIREAARRMHGGGRICTIASVAGKRGGGLSGTAAYAASKGAVLALSRNAARVLAERGIVVNCIAPGPTMTPMVAHAFDDADRKSRVEASTLLGRSGEPAEIAEAIAWLLSPRASFVVGETLTVDGGLMLD